MMLCMDGISMGQMLLDRDTLVRDLLPVLGDGAGRHNAEAAVTWALDILAPLVLAWTVERTVGKLAGVSEAASIVGTTRANVLRWSNGHGRTDFPAPVLTLSCGPHWADGALYDFAKENERSVLVPHA